MFAAISDFTNTSHYLSILNGALLTDLLFLVLLIFGVYQSKVLEEWYRKYTLSAVIEDVLILVIGVVLARLLYKPVFGESFSIVKLTFLAVCIQIVHDILFYVFFTSIPVGKNKMMDTFKQYAKEVGVYAILADSCMTTLTVLLSSWLASYNLNVNLIVLIFVIYLFPYTLYTL